MTDDIAKELDKIEKRLNELDNDPIMRLIHVNYMVMLEQAKAQHKSKRWFICEDLR